MTTAAHSEKSVTHWRKVFAFLLFGVVILAALALASSSRAAVESPPPPQVWSDKADYAPGETVTLSGANWAVGEAVHIRVNDDAGQTWSRDVDVTAADDGSISDQFNLPDSFIAVYTVTATGASSGTATWSFTDGNIKVKSAGGKDFNYTVRGFSTSSDCTTGGGSTATHLGDTNGTTESSNAGQSLLITANLNANSPNSNAAFQNWSNPNSLTISVGSTSTRAICVAGFASGSKDLIGNYGNTATVIASDNATRTVNEGQTASNTGTWSDSNPSDTVTLTASVGTVTKSGTNTSGTWNWSFTTNDGTAQSQTVTITANDGTTTATTTFDLTVNNVAPTAIFNAPASVNEGSNISLSLTSPSDPSSVDTTTGFTYAFDCGSGYGAFSATSSASCSTNDNGSRTVKGKIKDKDNGETEYTASVTINNVAPTAIFNAPASVNEGSNISLSLTSPSDPSSVDTSTGFTYAFDCGTGSGYGAFSATSTASCSTNDNGSRTVKGKIKDKDGGETEYTASVTINNVAPTGTLGNNGPKDEGSAVSVSFTGVSDPSSVDAASLHYAFDCAGGSLAAVTYAGAGTSSSTSCTFNDNGSYTVSGVIIDKDGGRFNATTAVTVTNAPPTGTLGNNGPKDEGSAVSVSFTGVSDPSSVDAASLHYAFDCAGGSLAAVTYAGAGTSSSTSCTFNDNGSYTVSGVIIDKDGGRFNATTAVTVTNAPPTGTLGNNGPKDEGSAVSVSFTGVSDPSSVDAASLHYAFDCAGGSLAAVTYAGAGTSSSTSCTFNDNGSYTVSGVIIDKDGGRFNATTAVTVTNAPPTGTLGNNGPKDEGSAVSVSFTGVSDPSSVDAASLHYAFDCAGGSLAAVTYAGAGTSSSTSCTFNDNGSYTVSGVIIDKDGGRFNATTAVTVTNAPPTGTLGNNGPKDEGSAVSVSFTGVSDPSSVDAASLHYAFDCAGGSLAAVTYAGAGTSSSTSCTFNDNGSYTVSGVIIDKDGGRFNATTTVTVNNVAPTADFTNNGPVNEGSSFTLSMDNGDDVSSADKAAKFTFAFDCGDGSGYGAFTTTPTLSASTSCSTNDNGTRSVKAKIRDKDGGVSEYTASVTVNNVAPTADFTNNGPVNEGSSFTLSMDNGDDVSSADKAAKFTFAFDCGDGSGYGAFTTTPTLSASTSCSTNDNGTRSVKAKIRDKDGGVSEYTASVTVNNVAPTADFTNNGPVNEGSSFTLSMDNGDDVSSADKAAKFTFAFDCGDGSGYGAFTTTPTLSASTSCSTNDNGTRSVKAKIRDKDGGVSEYTASVTVNNVAPTADFTNNGPVNEGSSFTLSMDNGDDVSSADKAAKFTFAFDCGDGSGYGAFTTTPTLSASTSCSTNDNGTRSVKAKIRDKDGGVSEYTASVTVNNVAPTADFTNNGPVNEGSSFTLSMDNGDDVSSADKAAKFTFAFDCGDGSGYGAFTTTPTLSASTSCSTNDNGTRSVKAKIRDKDGGVSEYTASVTVNNVAPTADFTNNGPVNEGSSFTLSMDNGDDVSSADKAAKFTFAFDCGDGSGYGAFTTTPTLSASTSCSTNDNGTRSVKAKIRDKDGGVSEYTASVTVNNVAPTVTLLGDATANEGDTKSYSYSWTDPSSADTFPALGNSVSCGIHGTASTVVFTPASKTGSFDCTWSDDSGAGTADVKATVTDDDGGADTDTINVTVANVAPQVNLTGPNTADEGQTKTYNYTITDPGTADTFSFVAGYPTCGLHGDLVGTPLIGAGSFQCSFPDGPNTTDVKMKVQDDDGGVSTADTEHVEIIQVAIANVAPTVTAASNQSSDEGELKSFSLGSFSDPGTDSPWAVDVNWGDGSTHDTFDETSTGAASGQTIAAKSHKYDDNGLYTVTVKVTDKNGAYDSKTFQVTVANVAPTVTLLGDATANEGDTKSYSYSWTDPSSADTFPALGNSVSCGIHGTASTVVFTPASKTGSFDCTWSDDSGAGTADVKATVTDDDGGADTDTINVTVANVAPQVNLTGPNTADEGQTKTYNYTITDPGTADTFSFVAGYPTCGLHGDLVGTPLIGAGSFQCSFPDGPNTTDVKMKVQDDDGGVSTADTEHVEIIQVAIANVAPTVTAASNQSSDEGELKSFSLGSFSDPGTDSPWAVDVNWGDGSTHDTFDETSTGAASGQTIAAKSHKYDDNGLYTVTVKVTDKNGAYDSKTFQVTVANVAPTATFSNTGPVNEGTSFTLSLTDPHDPSGADTTAGFTYAFDCGDGSGYGAYGSSNSRSCPTTDNGTRAVKGKIKDKDGGYTAYSDSVTVNNVAPTVTAASSQSSDEGENHSFSLGSFSDPGSDSPWAVDVDWGDTSTHTTFNETFAGPAASHAITSKSHKYDDNATYTVTVKVTDKDGGTDSKSFQVTVANVPPTGTLGSNTPINEGGSATVSFSAISDPSVTDSGTLHYAFDCSGGSLAAVTYSTSTPTNSKSCSYDDGPSDHTVTGVIIDKDGGRHDDTTSVHVNNVAPSATFNSPATVNEGSSFTLSLTSPSDPSTADAGAGFTYAFDCGSGTYGAFGASNSTSCPTSDNGTLSVHGKIKDKDGGERAYTASVTVNNVAPTATFSNDGPVAEGSSFTIQLTSPSDPSSADTSAGFTYAFDCGSGYGAYGTATSRSCPTTDNGTRAVKGKIKDKDGGVSEYTGSVTVNNVAPHITSVTASNSFVGPLVFMTSSISTLFTDPGSADTWINYLTFSDGGAETSTTQPTAQGGNSYKFTLTHSFATPGCKTVTSRVNDDDGGFDTFGPTPVNVGTGEFLPPVTNTPVTNQLKNGQVLPVKVKLTDCNGLSITNLNPAIALKKGDLTSVSDDNIVAITPTSVSNADTTGFMRPSGDGSYIYNMNVNIQLNTDYTLIVYPYGTGSPTQYIAHVIRATK